MKIRPKPSRNILGDVAKDTRKRSGMPKKCQGTTRVSYSARSLEVKVSLEPDRNPPDCHIRVQLYRVDSLHSESLYAPAKHP